MGMEEPIPGHPGQGTLSSKGRGSEAQGQARVVVGGCGDSPLTGPPFSVLKRRRKTSNPAWSLEPIPALPQLLLPAWPRGQGLAQTLPAPLEPSRAPRDGATALPCQDLQPRGSSSPATHWPWLSSHSRNLTGTPGGHLLPPLHGGSGVPALASPLPTAPEGDPELPWQVPTTPHHPWDPQSHPSPLPSTDTVPVSPRGTWGHCNPSTNQSGASGREARTWGTPASALALNKDIESSTSSLWVFLFLEGPTPRRGGDRGDRVAAVPWGKR